MSVSTGSPHRSNNEGEGCKRGERSRAREGGRRKEKRGREGERERIDIKGKREIKD